MFVSNNHKKLEVAPTFIDAHPAPPVELRLERLDTKLDQLEKRLSDGFAVVNTRLEGFENRLARKADTWVVTAGLGGLGLLLTIYKFFV